LNCLSEKYKAIRIEIDSLLMQATLAQFRVSVHTRREAERASREARLYLLRGNRQAAERYVLKLQEYVKELRSQLAEACPPDTSKPTVSGQSRTR
jgi:hypothetical protein